MIGEMIGAAGKARLSITRAQILDLPTTALTIVPAPGPGRVLIPVTALVYLTATTPFAGSDADFADLYIAHTSGVAMTAGITNRSAQSISDLTSFLNAGGWSVWQFGTTRLGNSGADTLGTPSYASSSALPTNEALKLWAYDDSSPAWTGGGPTDTLTVYLSYIAVEL